MANYLMFHDVEGHVHITQMCACVLTVHFNVFVTGRHIFSLVWVYIFGNTNFPYLHGTVSLNMLSSYIYTYMLITTFRVYTYIILFHSINNLSETLQKPLHHVTILVPHHLTH